MIEAVDIEQLDEVFSLIKDVVRGLKDAGIDQWDEIYPAVDDIETDIRSRTAYAFFIDGSPAAYIALNEDTEPQYDEADWIYTEGRQLIIHRLSVSPAYSGQGLGTKMVEFAEAEAVKNGYASIRLDAFSKNPAALYLYEKSGYRRAGEVTFRKGRFYLYEKKLDK